MEDSSQGGTASVQHCVHDVLVDLQSIRSDLAKKVLVSTYPDVAHLQESGIWVDKLTLRDEITADLFFIRRRHRAFIPECLQAVCFRRGGRIQVALINPRSVHSGSTSVRIAALRGSTHQAGTYQCILHDWTLHGRDGSQS